MSGRNLDWNLGAGLPSASLNLFSSYQNSNKFPTYQSFPQSRFHFLEFFLPPIEKFNTLGKMPGDKKNIYKSFWWKIFKEIPLLTPLRMRRIFNGLISSHLSVNLPQPLLVLTFFYSASLLLFLSLTWMAIVAPQHQLIVSRDIYVSSSPTGCTSGSL